MIVPPWKTPSTTENVFSKVGKYVEHRTEVYEDSSNIQIKPWNLRITKVQLKKK